MQEGVLGFIVCGANRFLETNGMYDQGGRYDIQDFHYRVVEGIIRREEVKVTSYENY